jgi:tetratricopeptide (TPR) repeat protein
MAKNGLGKSEADSGQDVLLTRLDSLLLLLEKAHGEKPKRWYDKLHETTVFFAKYIGLPGVILAAIGPSYDLIKGSIERRHTEYIRDTYTQHAQSLLANGEIGRARTLLGDLKLDSHRGAENQYLQAKLLAKETLTHGTKPLEAQDRINLLLSLHNNRPYFFPPLGGQAEVFELELALLDIDINLQRYHYASEKLNRLKSSSLALSNQQLSSQVLLREAQIAVLTFNVKRAEAILKSIIPVFEATSDRVGMAEASFQLAKAQQFQSKATDALSYYQTARELFEKLNDKQGILRTYNNMGMLHGAQNDHAKARYYYELQQRLARELQDETALARALVNLSLVSRHERKFPEAIRLAEEAVVVFQKNANKLGVASAHPFGH